MTELIKIAIGITIVTALLSAIDFGRDDVNKIKEHVTATLNALKDNPQAAGQKLQETVNLLQEQLQQQTQQQTKATTERQTTAGQQQPQKQKHFPDFYSGGDWDPKEFYK